MKRRSTVIRTAAILLISGAMVMAAPALAPSGPAGPGTLNYIEGQVSIDGRAVDSKSVGSEVLQPGATLATGNGKAEMLLTPGVFLRLGSNSRLQMTSSGLADIRAALLQGQATVEADNLVKDTHLTVAQGPADTTILKKGMYVLNATQPFVQVIDGKAEVAMNDQHVKVGKGGQAVVDASGRLKHEDFRLQTAQNEDLVRWSRLRSAYESEANIDTANAVYAGNSWYGPGWYWDAGYGFYSYLPGDGILYNPWGFGFYSPWYAPVFVGGYYGYPGGYRGGFARGGFRGGGLRGGGVRGGVVRGGGFRGGGGAVRGGAGGFHGAAAGGGSRGGGGRR